MDIGINEVKDIIESLESNSEISIKEEKYLKVAKLCVQLAAENVALKTFCKNAAFDADYEAELGMERGGFTDALNNIEIPATDRIVAGIKADGVEEWVSRRGGRWNGTTEEALKFAKQLREGADK